MQRQDGGVWFQATFLSLSALVRTGYCQINFRQPECDQRQEAGATGSVVGRLANHKVYLFAQGV
jgi:hypothetical protein